MAGFIRGRFDREPSFHPLLVDVLRPAVEANVAIAGQSERIWFSIDTGADYTILQPRGAQAVLGPQYSAIRFESETNLIDLYGISGSASPFVIRHATLTFRDEQGARLAIDLPILIARPSTPEPTPDSNWEAPSLLGQDALRHFDLSLSYNPPSVTLTEAVPA